MEPGFVDLDRAAEARDVHATTMRRWLRRAGLSLWRNPLDRRKRLVRLQDLAVIDAPERVVPVARWEEVRPPIDAIA